MFDLLKKIYRRVHKSYELSRYNSFTIAEYLRKQGATIGENCSIHPTKLGMEPYLVKIGNHVAIADGVKFITHDGGPWVFREEVPDIQVFGPIIIEDNVVVGMNAVLFPNVRIGRDSIIGAGSVVISDVPPETIVMGIPARPLGSVKKYKEKCLERWQAQRPPDCFVEPGATWWTSRHFDANRAKLRRHLTKLFAEQLGEGRPPHAEGRSGSGAPGRE